MPGGGGSGTARLTVRAARGRVTAHPCETGVELAESFCPWARDGASLP